MHLRLLPDLSILHSDASMELTTFLLLLLYHPECKHYCSVSQLRPAAPSVVCAAAMALLLGALHAVVDVELFGLGRLVLCKSVNVCVLHCPAACASVSHNKGGMVWYPLLSLTNNVVTNL